MMNNSKVNFKCALWALKQQLAWKYMSALWTFYCSTINILTKYIFGISSYHTKTKSN